MNKPIFAPVLFLGLIVLPLTGLFPVDKIVISSDRAHNVFAKGKEQTVISGNAHIVTGSFDIKADEIVLYGSNQRYVESKGPVVIHDSKRQLDIRGDSLFFDREADILQLTGNTQLEDYKNEMVLRGARLESRNKENISIVQVGVRILKKDINARCEMLVYRRDDDQVELSGLPVVYKKQDVYRATTISINLKNEEIQLQGRVQGSVLAKKNQSKPDDQNSDSGTSDSADTSVNMEPGNAEKKPADSAEPKPPAPKVAQ